ncbi:hypothetical protein DPMN_069342 [Dreissena polymorpha]|uniref:Uncharacterized protein n=1 Tax=Dreissena polymorpha TaxID=45954 RepID=A0A9D4BUW6_DREPO|nr:hypothetical protein DPMN_069342 [Dreissena polymorpha]
MVFHLVQSMPRCLSSCKACYDVSPRAKHATMFHLVQSVPRCVTSCKAFRGVFLRAKHATVFHLVHKSALKFRTNYDLDLTVPGFAIHSYQHKSACTKLSGQT